MQRGQGYSWPGWPLGPPRVLIRGPSSTKKSTCFLQKIPQTEVTLKLVSEVYETQEPEDRWVRFLFIRSRNKFYVILNKQAFPGLC